jgi:tetratricopeptide (TPR) repeat protein
VVGGDDHAALVNKSLALITLGRNEEAGTLLKTAREADDSKPDLWWAIAVWLQSQARHAEALDAVEESLRLDPQEPDPWRTKSAVLRALERDAEASDCEARAAEIDARLAEMAALIPTTCPLASA